MTIPSLSAATSPPPVAPAPPEAASWRTIVAGLVFGAAAIAEVVLAALAARSGTLVAGHWRFVEVLAGWTAAFAVATIAAWRLPARRAVLLIVAAGLAMRIAALAGPPTTSDDLYRYAWDGRVQAAGIDPYAWEPTSRHVVDLRETWLWPKPAVCAAAGLRPGCTHINRPTVRTIYPPLAEVYFAAVYRLGGIGARHKSWQVGGLVADTVTLALLAVALGRWGRDRRWLALYALCPAPALEFVNNAHVDAVAVAFVVAALVVARAPAVTARRSRWGEWAGRVSGTSLGRRIPWRLVAASALLASAALVKLYPGVLLLALVAWWPGRRLVAAAWATATTVVAFGVAYAPHVLAVGAKVLGYLPGYLKQEGYHNGGRYLIAYVLRVPHHAAGAVTAVAAVVVAVWVIWRRPNLPGAARVLFATLLLVATPAQPWYAVALLALATVTAAPQDIAVVAAAYGAALPVVFAPTHAAGRGGVAYGIAACILVLAGLWHRVRQGGTSTSIADGGPALARGRAGRTRGP